MITEDVMAKIQRTKTATAMLLFTKAERFTNTAQREATWKDRTGDAREGLKAAAISISDSAWQIVLSHSVEYGKYLEEGTPPHKIHPDPKKHAYLHFKVGDHFVKTKEVNHPGTKPYPAIKRTMEKEYPKLLEDVKELWSD